MITSRRRYNKHTLHGIVRLTMRLKTDGLSWNEIFHSVKKNFPIYRGSVGALSQLWLSYKDRKDELVVPKRRRREQPEDVSEQTPTVLPLPINESHIASVIGPIIDKELNRRATGKAVNILEKIIDLLREQIKELQNGETT
jgi:hypothetical protein